MGATDPLHKVVEFIIKHVLHEDINYTSYVMRKQFMSDKTQKNSLNRQRRLGNIHKHSEVPGILYFSFNEMKYRQNQKNYCHILASQSLLLNLDKDAVP